MRTIKFRGYSPAKKEWVYGDLITYRGIMPEIIYPGGSSNVVPESVGQFTGLLDKEGKEIYEGDVIQFNSAHTGFENFIKNNSVSFEDGAFGIKISDDLIHMGLNQTDCRHFTILHPSYQPA